MAEAEVEGVQLNMIEHIGHNVALLRRFPCISLRIPNHQKYPDTFYLDRTLDLQDNLNSVYNLSLLL